MPEPPASSPGYQLGPSGSHASGPPAEPAPAPEAPPRVPGERAGPKPGAREPVAASKGPVVREEEDEISHRGIAACALRDWLASQP